MFVRSNKYNPPTANMKNVRHILTIAALMFLAAGCAHESFVSRPAIHTAAGFQPQAGRTAEESALIQKHCPFGEPKLTARVNFGPVEEVTYNGYVLVHSSTDKIPLWVCEYIEARQLAGKAERRDNWASNSRVWLSIASMSMPKLSRRVVGIS